MIDFEYQVMLPEDEWPVPPVGPTYTRYGKDKLTELDAVMLEEHAARGWKPAARWRTIPWQAYKADEFVPRPTIRRGISFETSTPGPELSADELLDLQLKEELELAMSGIRSRVELRARRQALRESARFYARLQRAEPPPSRVSAYEVWDGRAERTAPADTLELSHNDRLRSGDLVYSKHYSKGVVTWYLVDSRNWGEFAVCEGCLFRRPKGGLLQ